MTDATARIKNLSIALEALSRINNEGSPYLYDKIAAALEKEIKVYKEQAKIYAAQSAEPSVDDDEIPF